MTIEQLAIFLPAALLLALAPGPDNMAVLALGASRGRAAGMGFALGCAAGCLNHTLLAALGVSAAIAASPTAFRILQVAGAAYLVWIGVQLLRARASAAAPASASTDVRTAPDVAPGTAEGAGFGVCFRRGLIANAINPKVAIFFLAFLPQFVRAEGWPAAAQIGVLGLLFGLSAAAVFSAIAVFAARLGAWLRAREGFARNLDRASGLLFIALGLRLALAETAPVRGL